MTENINHQELVASYTNVKQMDLSLNGKMHTEADNTDAEGRGC